MVIILIGPPASGKGTISHKICKNNKKILHIAPGEILVDSAKNNSKIKKTIELGNLVSDKIVSDLIYKKMVKNLKRDFILDGYPRSLEQAISLKKILEKINMKINYVFYFKIERKTLIERINNRRFCPQCKFTYSVAIDKFKKKGFCNYDNSKLIKRNDDNYKIFINRLLVYKNETQPIVDFYKQKSSFKIINCETQNVLKTIENEIYN